jgi:hypothetical protein
MSGVTYGPLVGDENYDIMYIESEPVGSLGYPDKDEYTVLGPVYTPRIYGLGLTSLEIASSSNVSLTLNDSHVLDFRRDSTARQTKIMGMTDDDLQLSTNNDSVRVTLDSSNRELDMYAENDINLRTLNGTIDISSTDSSLNFRAGTEGSSSNRSELSLSSDGTAELFAGSNLDVISTSSVLLEGAEGVILRRGDATADAFFAVNENNTITSTAQSFKFDAAASYAFAVDGAEDDVIKIERDRVTLRGDFDIHGTINSISHIETQLEIQDRTLRLAVSGNENTVIEDGEDNDKAGIVIDGFPSNADPTDATQKSIYQKSMKWNFGEGGIDDMLTNDGIDKESFWEFRGGSMRLTATKKDTGKDIGYGWRVNGNDELEMTRQFVDSNGNKKITRFMRFGRNKP